MFNAQVVTQTFMLLLNCQVKMTTHGMTDSPKLDLRVSSRRSAVVSLGRTKDALAQKGPGKAANG